ncbi:MAG: O-antigen ligase family protein [Pseudonocardiaceae bacterium]
MIMVAKPAATQFGVGRLRFQMIDFGVLLLGLGALVGSLTVTVGAKPALLVLAAVVGSVLLVVAVVRPAVALTLLVVSEFSNAGVVLPVPKWYIATLGLGVLSTLVALRLPEMRERLRHPPVAPVALLACYLLSLIPAVWFTETPAVTTEKMVLLLKDCVLLIVILALAHLVNRPWSIAAAIVLTLAAISAMTLINQIVLGAQPSTFGGFATVSSALGENITTPRAAGPLPDSNFWGRDLVLGLPLAYALWHRSMFSGRLRQVGWGLATATMLGGIYLTQSRGTLLATGALTVAWVVASGPRIRRQALLVAPLVALVLLIPGIGNRLLNVVTVFGNGPAYTVDPSLVERAAAQEIAAVMFRYHPLFGTGTGSFPEVFYEYATRTQGVLIGSTTAPHDIYLELASESGLVGLTGWLVLVIGTIALSAQTVTRLAGAPQDGRLGTPTRALAAGALTAIFGWSVASLFLHLAYFRPVLIVIALAGLLHTNTRDMVAQQPRSAAEASTRAARGLRHGSVTIIVVIITGAVTASGLLLLGQQRYTSQALFTLAPAPRTYRSYALDVRSRIAVLPAYAAMIQSVEPMTRVQVDGEPVTGLITMTAQTGDLMGSERLMAQTIAAAPLAIQRFGADRSYRLIQVSPIETTVERSWSDRAIALTTIAVLAELGVITLVARHIRTHRRDQLGVGL